MEFKAGDLIRCIDAGCHTWDLTKGKIYKVTRVESYWDGSDCVYITVDDGTPDIMYYAFRFIKVYNEQLLFSFMEC